jgi:hypothetical protein
MQYVAAARGYRRPSAEGGGQQDNDQQEIPDAIEQQLLNVARFGDEEAVRMIRDNLAFAEQDLRARVASVQQQEESTDEEESGEDST